MPVSLVVEHSGEIADDVNDTKDETVFRAHREIASVSIARDGVHLCSVDEELMHLADASNLVRRRVDGEHEGENDGEKDCGMRVVAEQSRSHSSGNDVDCDTEGDEEACRDCVHASQRSHSC